MHKNITRIYLCYAFRLYYDFSQSIINKSYQLKVFNGIYIFTSKQKVILQNNLIDIEKHEYFATKILNLATRYKRLKIQTHLRNFYSFPFADNYQASLRSVLSFFDLIIRSFELRDQKIILYINSFGDNIIDYYFIKHLKKEYNLRIEFSDFRRINPESNIFYTINKNNILSILSSIKWTPIKKKKNFKLFRGKKCFFITHPITKSNEPYLYFLHDKKIREKIHLISFKELCAYGLNRNESFIWFLKEIFNFFTNLKYNELYNLLKTNLFCDYLQLFSNKLYSYNLSILLNKTDIKYIFCSFKAYALEKLIFKTCSLCNIKSIQYDWSLGYPIENKFYSKEITLISNPDILLVGSAFREFQYSYANRSYLSIGNNMEIIISKCFSVDYAINKNKSLLQINRDLKFKKKYISIFDNVYGENAGVRLLYTRNLIQILYKNCSDFKFIVHSKDNYNYLDDYLNIKKMNSIRAIKGDFSLVSEADFVISIGFQGAAIKGASAFNKPILFFSSDDKYFSNFNFVEDFYKNRKLNKIFHNLTFNNKKLDYFLSDNKNYQIRLEELRKDSIMFFNKICVSNKTSSTLGFLKKLL